MHLFFQLQCLHTDPNLCFKLDLFIVLACIAFSPCVFLLIWLEFFPWFLKDSGVIGLLHFFSRWLLWAITLPFKLLLGAALRLGSLKNERLSWYAFPLISYCLFLFFFFGGRGGLYTYAGSLQILSWGWFLNLAAFHYVLWSLWTCSLSASWYPLIEMGKCIVHFQHDWICSYNHWCDNLWRWVCHVFLCLLHHSFIAWTSIFHKIYSLHSFISGFIWLHVLLGKKTDRNSISYSLQGSSSRKTFRAFNALGIIAFSFGDAMLPEIQVTCHKKYL